MGLSDEQQEALDVIDDVEAALGDQRARTQRLARDFGEAFTKAFQRDEQAMVHLKRARIKLRRLQELDRHYLLDAKSGYVIDDGDPNDARGASMGLPQQFISDDVQRIVDELRASFPGGYRCAGYKINWWTGPENKDVQVDFGWFSHEDYPTRADVETALEKRETMRAVRRAEGG